MLTGVLPAHGRMQQKNGRTWHDFSLLHPWHKASFDTLLNDSLPRLLAEYIPLVGYSAKATGRYTCQIKLTLMAAEREAELTYKDLPMPDENGVFQIKGQSLVVVPRATNDDLANTDIFCVGEQLYEYLQSHLGKAPDDLPWYSELAKTWLPLDQWINDFFDYHGKDGWATYVQPSTRQTGWHDKVIYGASPSRSASIFLRQATSGAPAPLKRPKVQISDVSFQSPSVLRSAMEN